MKKTGVYNEVAENVRQSFLAHHNGHPGEVKAGTPTCKDVAATLLQLRDVLTAEYGHDFSFQVIGQGHVLAASNAALGQVMPVSIP